MVNIRSANEIILNLLDYFRTAQPDGNLSPGSVIRDLFVEMPASQISLLYDQLSQISNLQSLRLVSGSSLDKLAQNFGVSRKQPASSSGLAVLTFSSIPAVISIGKGDLVTASNGASFTVLNGVSVNPALSNSYRSVAAKYKNNLNFLNITDQYAVEITVQATSPGSSGNINQYSLNSTNIGGVNNVFNASPFTGGTDQEDDATFRNRVLSIFSGSSVGTSLGYKNVALSDPGVLDALVIEPGDPLMTRDGTQVENENGTLVIISEGTGGKVDIIILGNRLTEFFDTFIYQDASNNNDPSSSKNDHILGQVPGDENKTIARRRIDGIAAATLPAQPVQEILEVTGSLSGSNFVSKTIDSLGRVSGNYEIIKDDGIYGGSPWGFDTFHWVSNKISLFQEDVVKGKFGGQDQLTFTDVSEIPEVQQEVSITNENSKIFNGDNSLIQLLHFPITNVTRVFNANTGERYVITDQNPNSSGPINTSGVIKISGNTLPSSSDILQVDYTWVVSFDPYIDYDGRYLNNNPRSVQDSIDWGISNVVRKEFVDVALDTSNSFYSGTTKHSINYVISSNMFEQGDGYITQVVSGNFAGRLAVIIPNRVNDIINVDSIQLQNTDLEIFATAQNNGSFSSQRLVYNNKIVFTYTIILPTDTPAVVGNDVTVIFNVNNAFSVGNVNGNFNNDQITIPVGNILSITGLVTPPPKLILELTYVSNIQNALSASLSNLPLSRLGNGFISDNSGFNNNFIDNIFIRENKTVQKNGLNQYYLTLNENSVDYSLVPDQVLSVIRLSDGYELWDQDNVGAVSIDTSNNYQLILNGAGSPSLGDKVLIIFSIDDNNRTQPFTFKNNLIRKDFATLQFDYLLNKFYVPFFNFTSANNLNFEVIDPSSGNIVASGSDGYVIGIGDLSTAEFGSASLNFSNLYDAISLKVRVMDSHDVNLNATYDILSVNVVSNLATITNVFSNMEISQISVVRIADGKDYWNSDCTIDQINRRLVLPNNLLISQGDEALVIYFVSENLRQAPSKLSVTLTDQINNNGVLTISGETINKVSDVVITAVNNGLKHNVIEAMLAQLNLTNASSIPTNISLIRIVKLERVNATTDNQVLSVINDYDLLGSAINENTYYSNDFISDGSLAKLDFTLPPTINNLGNEPNIGDKLRITFYYVNKSDSEDLYFTRNGTLYTNKTFAFMNRIFVSSGFVGSQSTRFILNYFNQPGTSSRYTSFYNYFAPKQNERITIRYNYNKLISDITFDVETSRPITADVLVKSAKEILVDATLTIVVSANFSNSANIVIQNVQNQIINAINTGKLGDTISGSTLITAAQSVDGVERSRIIYFNKDGETGQVLSLTAQKNQYFTANDIVINQEAL